MKNPVGAYRQFSVQGATPFGLIVMLYDGAITAFRCAIKAMETQDIEQKCHHIKRALAIVSQLEGSLNFELGGDVAKTLKSLYVYTRVRAQKANIENSPETIQSLIDNLSTVREAWHQADTRPTAAPATPAPTTSAEAPREATASKRPAQLAYPSLPAGIEAELESASTREPGSWRVSA